MLPAFSAALRMARRSSCHWETPSPCCVPSSRSGRWGGVSVCPPCFCSPLGPCRGGRWCVLQRQPSPPISQSINHFASHQLQQACAVDASPPRWYSSPSAGLLQLRKARYVAGLWSPRMRLTPRFGARESSTIPEHNQPLSFGPLLACRRLSNAWRLALLPTSPASYECLALPRR